MDIFVEQLVRRKRRPIDFLRVFLCLIAATIVILFMLIGPINSMFGSIIFLVGAALVYLLYLLATSINLEYEYCFTNGSLDVDKVIAARRRKRLTTLNARNIEMMATTKNRAFSGYMQNREIKKIYACSSLKDDNVFFVIYSDNSGKKMLLFNPNDKIKDGFRLLNPQKVFLTD